jgi:hypothetical protein
LCVQAGPFVKDAFGHWTSHIRLETTAAMPPERQDEWITICTSDPLYRELKVAVILLPRAGRRIVATPSEVNLSAGPRLVRLHDQRDQAVVIESVTADDPVVVCSWAAGPDNQATLKLQHDRTAPGDHPQRTFVHVQISQPAREVLTIPVVVAKD